jgi:molybdenum cofactor cytidylyltransferase
MPGTGKVAGVILAAGRARRFAGQAKPLLPYGANTILETVTCAASNAGLDPILVVIGHHGDRVKRRLRESGVTTVHNPDFDRGQATSLAVGVQAIARDTAVTAAAILLADEPGIQSSVIRSVIDSWRASDVAAARAVYKDRPGHPVVLARSLFPALAELEGDEGARSLLRRLEATVLELAIDGHAPIDVDGPAEYRRALDRLARGRSASGDG